MGIHKVGFYKKKSCISSVYFVFYVLCNQVLFVLHSLWEINNDRCQENNREISKKISDLNEKDGSTVDVMIDSKNNFKAIFY